MRRKLLFSFSIALTALIAAVGPYAPSSSAQAGVSPTDDFVLFASERLVVSEGANVASGNVGSNGTVNIAEEATASCNVFGNEVRLGRGASVLGSVLFNTLRLGESAEILGEQISPLSLPVASLPSISAFTPGTSNVKVGEGSTQVIQPGSYDTIRLAEGASATFMGGTYNVAKLALGMNASITFATPTTLNIKSALSVGANSSLVPAPGLGAAGVALNYAGKKPTKVGDGSLIRLTLLAPDAKITMGDGTTFEGQVLAKNITAGMLSVISSDNGNGCAPVLAPIGDQTVSLGSTLDLKLSGNDPDGDPITFGVLPLPLLANASLHAQDGEFTFNPDETQVGSFELTFQVSDDLGAVDSETITITVEGPEPGGITSLTGRLLDTNDFTQGTETPVV